MSLITIFVLTIVLGMVINAGREVDEKVRLQNAADAATYSGGAAIARGYNALAFSNHLEGEIFGLVAIFRTHRDIDPQKDPTTLNFEMAILDAWNKMGGIFATSSFPKFAALGPAIQQKVPLEKDLVTSFLKMGGVHSALVLGPLESILQPPDGNPRLGGVIPRFQRTLVQTIPQAAQLAASDIAQTHGQRWQKQHQRQPLTAVMWRTNVMPLGMGNELDPSERTLPVFDPSPTGPDGALYTTDYLELARCHRMGWATGTMRQWIQQCFPSGSFYRGIPYWNAYPPPIVLPGGATSAKMSAMYWIFQIYCCGQLNKLDQENYAINVPFVYRVPGNDFTGQAIRCPNPDPNHPYDCSCLDSGIYNPTTGALILPGYQQLVIKNVDPAQTESPVSPLELYHTFVGVVYWPRMTQTSPVFFRYPLSSDAMAFAQVSVFVPQARFNYLPLPPAVSAGPWRHVEWCNACINPPQPGTIPVSFPSDNFDPWPWRRGGNGPNCANGILSSTGAPGAAARWDLTIQNWAAKLAPATSDSVAAILQNPMSQQFAPGVRVPNLGGTSPMSLRQINTH